MSKKIDINKLLTTGSAKQRAVLLFYHYNIKEAIDKDITVEHKLPLTDKEAKALFDSFTSAKDIKVYNDYRQLNIKVIHYYKWLLNLYKSFEIEYWKYWAIYLMSDKGGITKDIKVKINEAREELLIYSYSEALQYYTAFKIYIKESGYRDKLFIGAIDKLYKELIKTEWEYPIKNGDKDIYLALSEVEADQEEVKRVLKVEFNLEYETEE